MNLQKSPGVNGESVYTFRSSVPGGFGGKGEKRLNHLKCVPKCVGGRGKFQQPPSHSLEARDACFLFLHSVINPIWACHGRAPLPYFQFGIYQASCFPSWMEELGRAVSCESNSPSLPLHLMSLQLIPVLHL